MKQRYILIALGVVGVGLWPAWKAYKVAFRKAPVSSVETHGTEFSFVTPKGVTFHSPDLVGAIFTYKQDAGTYRVRIDAVERDPQDKTGEVWLHHFSVERPDKAWEPVCEPAADGNRWGFPLAGRSTADGILRPAEPGVFDIACLNGARGKCVRIGYHPWRTLPDGSSVLPYYNACVRMIRADYSGQGIATTRNGTLIDIYDRAGVVDTDPDDDFTFEAGWTENGAVCVQHPRIRDNISLDDLESKVSRLRGKTGAICNREYATAQGALVFNGSKP